MLMPGEVQNVTQMPHRTSTAASLCLCGITKRYGLMNAVQDIWLTVEAGEFLTLLGPSGCGKTTLLNLIAGHIAADSGTIAIAGRPMEGIAPNAREIGMVFQNYALFPHMTVAKNVGYGLRMRGMAKAAIAPRVADALAAVQLSGLESRKPRELSGGQQQRVALARALVIDPKVMLLDEPFSALDKNLRTAMRSELKELQRRLGITTVFVTHDQSEALSLSDRVAVMADGSIHQVGTPEEVYRRPAGRFVASFVGDVAVLAGTVEAVAGDSLMVRAGEARLTAHRAGFPDAQVGGGVEVFIRPEDLRLAMPGEAVAARGTVTSRIFQGGHVDIVIVTPDAPSGRIVMRRPVSEAAAALEPGTQALFAIAARDVAVFAPEK